MKQIGLVIGLVITSLVHAQNVAYRLIYDQVYPVLTTEYYQAKVLYQDISRMYAVDPIDRSIFSKYALIQGDVEFFKEETKDLMLQHGYFFSAADTLKNNSFIESLRKHNLTKWMVAQSAELYPQWIQANPTAYMVQQKLVNIKSQDKAAYYFEQCIEDARQKGDSVYLTGVEKFYREYEFEKFMEVLEICRNYGYPNSFDHGYGTTSNLSQMLVTICLDKFNFERSWHHIFPFMEKAYFDGKISDYFLKIYDRSCATHYGYQYFGTQPDSVVVKDEKTLAERRKKYGL